MPKSKTTNRQPRATAPGTDTIDAADEQAPATPHAPASDPSPRAPKGKIAALLALLRREEGADIKAMMDATGWQAHSVRGALSGAIKKNLGLPVISEKTGGERRYCIRPEATS
jgi:hypothetical protein